MFRITHHKNLSLTTLTCLILTILSRSHKLKILISTCMLLMRINVSRSKIDNDEMTQHQNVVSLGASYTHIESLKNIIGANTAKVVMYHSFLTSLEGFEDTAGVKDAYLGFNRISGFRPADAEIVGLKTCVLDLAGNPIKSLLHCPPCKQLIVSATLIEDLTGCPEGIEIVRCGHSVHLKSLKGCPKSVQLIECSCAPNLVIDMSDLPEGGELIR